MFLLTLSNLLKINKNHKNSSAECRKNIIGCRISINADEYHITYANNARPECISLYNPLTKKFLRHINGILIESGSGLNSAYFADDSSFIKEFEGEELVLKVSNENLKNSFVYKQDNNYVIQSAHTVPTRPKCRFPIRRPLMKRWVAVRLEQELLRHRQDMIINSLNSEIVSTDRKTLIGCRIKLNHTEYVITYANNARAECISLYNPIGRKFIRHYGGKLIESSPNINSLFFLDDSSFIKEFEGDDLVLKVSNANIANSYVYKQGDEYIILPAHEVPECAKFRFKIITTILKKMDAAYLERDLIRQSNDCAISIIRNELVPKLEKLYQYQTTSFLYLLRNNNFFRFSNGNSIWNFIDSKKCIKTVYASYEQLELFFYKRIDWDANLIDLQKKTDLYLKYGAYNSRFQISQMNSCIESNIPVIYGEDGFIHSIKSPIIYKNRREYRLGYSIIIDGISPYFDATLPTSIENELNSDDTFSQAEIDRAKILISEIVKNKLTKYNNQPEIPDIEVDTDNFESCVLVVDQVCNDWSIKKGFANEDTFINMLEAAIDENPEALILIKVHPVMLENPYHNTWEKHKLGHYTDYVIRPKNYDRVKFLASEANPYSILALVQKVYVCSSQLGFEALMAGKEVHIWGSPFYAGWGIGYQRIRSPAIDRRTKKRSLEEIFLSAYIHYSRYLNPFTWERCELEELLKSMVILRDRYFKYQELVKFGFCNFTEPRLTVTIPIVFAVDESRLLQTIIAISSLLHADPWNRYYIYCLSAATLSENIQKGIREIAAAHGNLAGIKFISAVVNTAQNLHPKIPSAKLLKFRIPELLPSLARVVYTDTNVIFLRGVSNAWEVSSDFNALIAACPDLEENMAQIEHTHATRTTIWDKYFSFSTGQYINGSFLILNLQHLRKDRIPSIWEQILQNEDDINSTDILYLGCKPKIYYLSSRYVTTLDFFDHEDKYARLFELYFPPEDRILAKKKTVAVQYPEDSPPWLSHSEHVHALWLRIIESNPELNEIINKYA